MYLINLSYIQSSHDSYFSASRVSISQAFGISESFISQGNQELRRLNLLDIQYSEIEGKSYDQRQPSIYTLQNLYNPEDFKKDLSKLEQKYGKDKLGRAVNAAKAVFEENNLKTIEVLIDLESQSSQEIVKEAIQKIADKNPDNPKRSAGYLINTIKNIYKQK